MEGKPEPTTTPKEETTQPAPQAAPVAKQPMFSKKMLLIGGGVIVAIAVIITMLMLLSGPSKSDYNEAVTVMKAVREDYKSMDSKMRKAASSMLSSGNSTSTEDVSLEKELNAYKENIDKLKGLKALRDKEVKEAYDKLASKNEKFIPYVSDLSASMGDLGQVGKVCGEVSTALRGVNPTSAEQAVSEFDKRMEPCNQALDKLKDVKNKTLGEFAGKMRKAMADVRNVLGELPALANSQDRSKMYELRSKLMKVVRSLSEESLQFSKKMREETKENDAVDEINALGKLVVQKYNDAK